MTGTTSDDTAGLVFRIVNPALNDAVLIAGQACTLVLTITNNTGATIPIERSDPTPDLLDATAFGLNLNLDALYTDPADAKGIGLAAGPSVSGLTAPLATPPAMPQDAPRGGDANGWACSWVSDAYGSTWAMAATAPINWDDGQVLTFILTGVKTDRQPALYSITVTHLDEGWYANDTSIPIQVRSADAPAKCLSEAVDFAITNPALPPRRTAAVLITKTVGDDIANKLVLTMTLKAADRPLVGAAPSAVPGGGRKPTLSVTARYARAFPGRTALTTPDQAHSFAVSVAPSAAWRVENPRPGPVWDFTATTTEVMGPTAGAAVAITLDGIVTPFARGPAVITLGWADIPGYADGTRRFIVEKIHPAMSLASFTATPVATPAGTSDTQVSLPGGFAAAPGTVALEWDVRYATHVVLSGHGPVSANTIGKPLVVPVSRSTTFVLTACDTVLGDIQTASVSVGMERSIAASSLPYGAILLWNGGSDRLPAGFALCDGTRGTPDLRDRFILGAGGRWASNASEDRDSSHRHGLSLAPAAGTPATVGAAGGHDHGLPAIWYHRDYAAASGSNRWSGIDAGKWDSGELGRLQTVDDHTHEVDIKVSAVSDKVDGGLRPPWFALCCIMRVSEPA